jgi:hypothetical protein
VSLQSPFARLGRFALTGVLAAALGFGAVACGGSSPSASGSSSPEATMPSGHPTGSALRSEIYRYLSTVSAQRRQAFVSCMHSNGEPNFPSQLTFGALQAAGITLRSSAFRSAFAACRSKLTG